MPIKFSAILIAVFLLIVFVLVGRTTSEPSLAPAAISVAATPEATAVVTDEAAGTVLIGDPVRGQDIFRNGLNGAPACKSCHATTAGHTMFALAPNLKGIAERAATRVAGMTAPQYIEDSIRHPEDYLVSGFRPIMYPNFGKDYSDQDIADVAAYLMTL